MSRIGKQPIPVPNGVTVTVNPDNTVIVKGPKGELSAKISPRIKVEIADQITVTRQSEDKEDRSLHGLSRTLIANMCEGVTNGFSKKLEIIGVGYRAQVQGNKVTLNLGHSHPIDYALPEGITIEQDKDKKNILTISGIDKQKVGQVAAEIRSFRKPEPYKGKGVRYIDEYVAMKAGKAATAK